MLNLVGTPFIIGLFSGVLLFIFTFYKSLPKWKKDGFVRPISPAEKKLRQAYNEKAKNSYKEYAPFILFFALVVPKLVQGNISNVILSFCGGFTVSAIFYMIFIYLILDSIIRKQKN